MQSVFDIIFSALENYKNKTFTQIDLALNIKDLSGNHINRKTAEEITLLIINSYKGDGITEYLTKDGEKRFKPYIDTIKRKLRSILHKFECIHFEDKREITIYKKMMMHKFI